MNGRSVTISKTPAPPAPAFALLLVAAPLVAALMATAAAAHEFWIEPEDYSPAPGATVDLRLFVGDGFDHGTPYPRNPGHLRSFFVEAAERSPVPGSPGGDPAGSIVAGAPGALLVGYESRSSEISLAAGPFEDYLRTEGLEQVIEERRRRGESAAEGREAFARAAKSLLNVDGETGGYDRRLDLPVEIVPMRSPLALAAGEPLEVLVLRHGEPLGGVQVRVFRRGHPDATAAVRTNEEGRALVEIDGRGAWLLSVVHMERAPAEADFDWQSTWSSLTFSTAAPGRSPE